MGETTTCPICGTASTNIPRGGNFNICCPICSGEKKSYIVTATPMHLLREGNWTDPSDRELVPYLSAYIRQQSDGVVITSDNWKYFAGAIRAIPVLSKLHKVLRLIESRSNYPGHIVEVAGKNDFPAVDAANAKEFEYLVRHLLRTGFVAFTKDHNHVGGLFDLMITPKGWEKLQASTDKGIPGRCFVAMSFNPTLNDVYDLAIEPALKGCGLDPRRVDKIPDNRDINEKMIAELRTAELVVADFTGQRNGVYFEAGFARGLGREVFWCCQKEEEDKIHFDTRQFNFILWTTLDDLKEGLTDKIRAMGFARN